MKPLTEFRDKTVVPTTDVKCYPLMRLEGDNPEGITAWDQGDITLMEQASWQVADLPQTFPATSVLLVEKVEVLLKTKTSIGAFIWKAHTAEPPGNLALPASARPWSAPGGVRSCLQFRKLMVEAPSGRAGGGGQTA